MFRAKVVRSSSGQPHRQPALGNSALQLSAALGRTLRCSTPKKCTAGELGGRQDEMVFAARSSVVPDRGITKRLLGVRKAEKERRSIAVRNWHIEKCPRAFPSRRNETSAAVKTTECSAPMARRHRSLIDNLNSQLGVLGIPPCADPHPHQIHASSKLTTGITFTHPNTQPQRRHAYPRTAFLMVLPQLHKPRSTSERILPWATAGRRLTQPRSGSWSHAITIRADQSAAALGTRLSAFGPHG